MPVSTGICFSFPFSTVKTLALPPALRMASAGTSSTALFSRMMMFASTLIPIRSGLSSGRAR